MRTSKFTVEQVARALKPVERDVAVAEICRELGIPGTTSQRWRRRFGGIRSPELRELRQLRDENRRRKRVLADPTLGRTTLQQPLREMRWGRASAAPADGRRLQLLTVLDTFTRV